jgi:uncharacterized protein (DUF924 family)
MASAAEIVRFWRDAGPKFWFVKDETFDGRCRGFENEHHAAARGELGAWEMDAEGALALLILLDQIPRNIFETARMRSRRMGWRRRSRFGRSTSSLTQRSTRTFASSSTCRLNTLKI